MTDDLDIPELTEEFFKTSILASRRNRIMRGEIESGKDIIALRRFVKLTQKEFAHALEISVHTLRNWEQGRRQPEGPAIALLKIAARHPKIIRSAAGIKPPSAGTAKR
ncbi:MAG: helix-turn-helix domain-containing protein [Deltaproteobacteria bacterium]|nr:helix-turn-helix domain-containing protein [Deltaproteobacteria bacterium]MBW2404055.1 helix-turn-helix domain-containing protein [Deltaproteobacteria bacterium]MBW2719570.1 helix-turn-helix domain-containing protein [Deltaproteobacteria bacterium]